MPPRLFVVSVLVMCAAAGCAKRLAHVPAVPAALCRSAVDLEGRVPGSDVAWRTDGATRASLDAWCGTVGPAVFEARPSRRGAGGGPGAVAIVSWNVHVGGGDIAGFIDALRAGTFTGGRTVGDFVLLLQEAYRDGGERLPAWRRDAVYPARIAPAPGAKTRSGRADIVHLARTQGLALYYAPSMRNGAPGRVPREEDRGNAILSTFALSDPVAIELPFGRQRRVALSATLPDLARGDAPPPRVVSVHLDTPRPFPGDRRGVRQAAALVNVLDADGEVPTIIGGDFNTLRGHADAAWAVMGSRFEPARAAGGAHTFEAFSILRWQLDHVFHRLPAAWTASWRRVDDRHGSDHFPLLGVLDIPASRSIQSDLAPSTW